MTETPFWNAPPEGFGSPQGLTSAEAAARLKRDGPNSFADTPRHGIITSLAKQLLEPLVVMLLIAALVSGLTGDRASLIIILAIVAISTLLQVFQEQGAAKAAEALRRQIALTVRVLRDGAEVTLPAHDVVRGDVIMLEPGDLVPADGVVLWSGGARVDEAILTGEPYPMEKRPGPSGATIMAEAYDALFAGTSVISGEARMIAAATGKASSFGAISASLALAEQPSAFARGLHRLGLTIMRLTLVLVMFVLLFQMIGHKPVVEAVMFAVALAVGLTPELLPMITTVTLSRGALRMAKKHVIVKRLAAIHDLGAMDVLCTDKTGTLTQAHITLCGCIGPDGADNGTGEGTAGPDAGNTLELAAVNAHFAGGIGNPLDGAILAASPCGGGWTKIAELPFDFERRRSSVLAEKDGRRLLIVKGAPEAVLGLCTLDDHARKPLDAVQEARAEAGERLLGIAFKPVPADQATVAPQDETALTFAGFCAFLDPPKPSAASALHRLKAMGIHVKVISGDAAPVVRHLAGQLGMNLHAVLVGEEIDRLSDAALTVKVRQCALFARVSPDQKTRIIRACQNAGHTVGFMGDGINDAPAIHAADCGLSVDGATDVARAAADMILLDNDLHVLADGVSEGRRTYGNILKYIRMDIGSNFGNMLSMALASLAIPFLPMTAVQVLLNNLIYDLSQFGLPFDRVDEADLARPHGWNIAAIKRFTSIMGPLSSLFDIATFALLLLVFHSGPAEFRTAWFVESMATQIPVVFVIRTRGLPWASRPAKALVASSLAALAAALFLALGPFAGWFGFAPLPGTLLATTAGLTLAYLVAAQFLKRLAL